METKYLSCAETAKLVRAALKEAFPAIKFSVKSSVYSGGASIRVKWTDGPNSDQVETITSRFCGGYFDGSIDYKGSVYGLMDGQKVHFGADFIFCNRDLSDATITRLLVRIANEYGCPVYSVEQFRRGELYSVYGPSNTHSDHWSIQSLVNRAAAKHTFALAKAAPTAERAEILCSDGYSLSNGSGHAYGDDEVIRALRHARL